jgi:hypothetical protein
MAPARGMSSGTANQEIFDRFSASGKDRLILLVVTDLDPAGDHIAQNFVNYMIRDAGLDEQEVAARKIALTMGQVRSLGLPESWERVKPKDGQRRAYIAKWHRQPLRAGRPYSGPAR